LAFHAGTLCSHNVSLLVSFLPFHGVIALHGGLIQFWSNFNHSP
jgi:hypothetical protein